MTHKAKGIASSFVASVVSGGSTPALAAFLAAFLTALSFFPPPRPNASRPDCPADGDGASQL